MQTKPRPRLVVLGLDGLPLPLAQELARRGQTPHLARLSLADQAHALRAELPELSPVNWTSFATGEGPERHGVFGFTRLDPAQYTLSLVDSAAVCTPTIFDRLGAAGLTSKVVNLPNTYPARPIKGMLIAGFTAPELTRAVHPPFLAGMLAQKGYRLEADTVRGRQDHEFLLADLGAVLDSRRLALDMLWPDLAWDLFTFVITETDRLFHFLYPAVLDEAHPLHPGAMGFIQQLDALVGDLLDRYDALPGPKRLMALADHGFTQLITEVDINAWLRSQGLLSLQGEPASELDATVISHLSAAFALDPGRVYLHTAARYARGGLGPAEAPAVRERIREGLLALRHEQAPVMRAVHRGEELYPGVPPELAAQVPDLVCEARPGFDLKAKFDRTDVFSFHGRSGTHTVDNAFFYDSAGATPDRMRDTGRLVLDFFGLDFFTQGKQTGTPATDTTP